LVSLVGCGDPAAPDSDESGTSADSGVNSTKVTFTVYTDEACTQLPHKDSVVEIDAGLACNATPDASISGLVCQADRITYTNHPNNSDCSSVGMANELFVGECQAFPGPVPTWKLIEADSYNCLTFGR